MRGDVGPVDQVATWQPLVDDEEHVHLDSHSALGAFYDISDAPRSDRCSRMPGTCSRVFLWPDGSRLYPAWAGCDRDMVAVAVLVDLELLDDAE